MDVLTRGVLIATVVGLLGEGARGAAFECKAVLKLALIYAPNSYKVETLVPLPRHCAFMVSKLEPPVAAGEPLEELKTYTCDATLMSSEVRAAPGIAVGVYDDNRNDLCKFAIDGARSDKPPMTVQGGANSDPSKNVALGYLLRRAGRTSAETDALARAFLQRMPVQIASTNPSGVDTSDWTLEALEEVVPRDDALFYSVNDVLAAPLSAGEDDQMANELLYALSADRGLLDECISEFAEGKSPSVTSDLVSCGTPGEGDDILEIVFRQESQSVRFYLPRQ